MSLGSITKMFSSEVAYKQSHANRRTESGIGPSTWQSEIKLTEVGFFGLCKINHLLIIIWFYFSELGEDLVNLA